MNKPIDLSSHPILQQAFDVIQAIEKCGASVELTNAVTEAGKLMEAINGLLAIRELKGEQVPVAFTAARWLDTRCKLSVWTDRESAVMEIGDNSKVAELYDHPQKPVAPCPTYCPHCSYSLHPEKAQEERNAERKAAIEAAGGIVKDGE